MGLGGALLDLLYPPRCVFCRRLTERGGSPVCPACLLALPRPEPGTAVYGKHFEKAVAPFWYEGAARESLLRYKFQGLRHYANVYGPLLTERVEADLSGAFELVCWVPLSRKRLRERGYDQAKLLAEAVAGAMVLPCLPLLEKPQNTPRQSRMAGQEARRANVKGAYRIGDPQAVKGRRVLLVDDILTTGATLEECAAVLRRAGAAGVVCAALARVR